MTRLRITLNNLPINSKRILKYIEYTDKQVTMTNVRDDLGLNNNQVVYAVACLRKLNLVKNMVSFNHKMSEKILSVNADTVARSDIKEMIHNV